MVSENNLWAQKGYQTYVGVLAPLFGVCELHRLSAILGGRVRCLTVEESCIDPRQEVSVTDVSKLFSDWIICGVCRLVTLLTGVS